MSSDNSRHRLGLVAITALSLFGALFARLWFLQIVEGETLEQQVNSNAQRVVVVPAPRGRILDRNGVVLVDNRQSIVVAIDTQVFGDLKKDEQARVLERLSTYLNRGRPPNEPLTVQAIRNRLNDGRFSRFRPVPVAEDLMVDQEIYFREQADRFPSVVVERQSLRQYPYGSLAAHLLGYVGSISEAEYAGLKALGGSKPYVQSDEIGRSGVESSYEKYLRGTPGKRVYEVDRTNRVVREIGSQRRTPKQGDDLYLAIDVRVQAETEISLRQGLEQRRGVKGDLGNYPAESGAAAVVDPANGQVMAMASYPTYDPSTLVGGFSCSVWRDLQGLPAQGSCDTLGNEIAAIPAADRPPSKLVNRAIAGLYPPGSTFKLATAYASLNLGLITPETTLYDPGYFVIPGCKGSAQSCRVSSPSSDTGGIGNVNLNSAITQSSDTYFYKLGNDSWALYKQQRKAGPTALQDEIAKFGIGKKTGIDVAGEKAGRLPDPAWLKNFDKELNGKATEAGNWQSGASINLAIGQGDVLVTPLQMANAYAAFANGGTLYQPGVIDHITPFNEPGSITKAFAPKVIRKLDFQPDAYAAMKDGFEGVTQNRVGATGKAAFADFPQDVWPAAGKTGTAQSGTKTNRREDHSWFVGFGPASDTAPARYSAAVIMEHSGAGGSASAPAVRRIFQTIATNGLGAVDLRALLDPNSVVFTSTTTPAAGAGN